MQNIPLVVILLLSGAIAIISTQQKFEIFKYQPMTYSDTDVDVVMTQVYMYQ